MLCTQFRWMIQRSIKLELLTLHIVSSTLLLLISEESRRVGCFVKEAVQQKKPNLRERMKLSEGDLISLSAAARLHSVDLKSLQTN